MDSKHVIKVARRLSAIAKNEFPEIPEVDLRESLAKALITAISDVEVMENLFDDLDDDLA